MTTNKLTIALLFLIVASQQIVAEVVINSRHVVVYAEAIIAPSDVEFVFDDTHTNLTDEYSFSDSRGVSWSDPDRDLSGTAGFTNGFTDSVSLTNGTLEIDFDSNASSSATRTGNVNSGGYVDNSSIVSFAIDEAMRFSFSGSRSDPDTSVFPNISYASLSGQSLEGVSIDFGFAGQMATSFSESGILQEGIYEFEAFNVSSSSVEWTSSGPFASSASSSANMHISLNLSPVSLPGDFNGDGLVDGDDIDLLSEKIGEPAAVNPAMDLDDNGTIELADHDQHITTLVQDANGTGALIGDLNLDGDVDVTQIIIDDGIQNVGDASVMLANLGQTSGQLYGDGDLNGDGDVDVTQIVFGPGGVQNFGDASRLLANLGQLNAGAPAAAFAIPEPTNGHLLVLTGAVFVFRRCRNSGTNRDLKSRSDAGAWPMLK